MSKNKFWAIDSSALAEVHTYKATETAVKEDTTLKLFSFNVRRLKDVHSQKEFIEISAFVDGDASGKITTNMLKMDSDLLQLQAYGIVMPRRMFTELRMAISENYYNLEKVEIDESASIEDTIDEEIVDGVLVMLAEYFKANETSPRMIGGQELYCISVKDFNEELKDSAYNKYSTTALKERFCDLNYTIANKGRYDYVVSIDNKKMKMV